MKLETDALVVGAGPTGLFLASELARHGMSCRLVDQSERPSEWSKALGVHARTLEILDLVGLGPEVLERGKPVRGISFYGANGSARRFAHVELEDLDTPYPFVLGLPQSETERILAAHAARLGVPIERGVRFAALTQHEDGVEAELELPGGTTAKASARWLIGCDGAHSTVRKALGLPFRGASREQDFALADVRLAWDRSEDEAHVFFSPDGVLAAIPMAWLGRGEPGQGGWWRLIADRPGLVPGGDAPRPGREALLAILRRRGAREAALLDAGWTTCFHVHRRIVPRYRAGRVFLAGDAAHVHSPVGGQGMNLGMQDAYNLAWKLALVDAGAGRPQLLDSYERERRPIAAATLIGTDLATRVITLKSPITRELRDRLASLLSGIEPVERRLTRMVSELDLAYRRSAIVREDRTPLRRVHLAHHPEREAPDLGAWIDFGAAPAAGERAPDVSFGPPGQPLRLFDVLRGTRHVLLLFEGIHATADGLAHLGRIAAEVEHDHGEHIAVHLVAGREDAAWSGSVLPDPARTLHARYGAAAECLYLVRPDGYVGYRAQPADAKKLARYLGRVLV